MHIRSPKTANGSPVACQAHPPRRGHRDRHGRHLQQRQLRRHQAEELQTMGAAEVELQLLVFSGISMVISWDFYGDLVGFLWGSHGISWDWNEMKHQKWWLDDVGGLFGS